MGTVSAGFATSLDGFIADPDDQVGPLFDWYFNGEVEVTPPGYPITFRMSPASAAYWNEATARAAGGALVCGRRLFDHTKGWGGNPPFGVPTFVVTHRPPPDDWPPRPDAPFTFVTDGLESALALAKAAGNGDVGVSGPNLVQQCLNAGLLDELRIELVPVLLGKGIRYFDNIENTAITFERVQVVEGEGVTHLRYRVHYK
jgi:dihydrofolate reductase